MKMIDKNLVPFTIEEMRNARGMEREKMRVIYHDWLKKARTQDKKTLINIENKVYRFKNFDKIKKWKKNWDEKNKDKIKEYHKNYNKKYRKKNKDKKNDVLYPLK